MLMINVGLSVPKASRLIKIFDKHKNTDGFIVHTGYSDLKDKEVDFLDEMCAQGFVCCVVSDWGHQELSYAFTDIGKQILRIK